MEVNDSVLPADTGAQQPLRRIAVRDGRRFLIIRTEEVVWIEGADNQIRIHTAGASYLHRTRMAVMEEMLDQERFVRVHRSIILAVDHVTLIEPWGVSEHLFILSDGAKVRSSRMYREAVRRAFGC